MSTGRIILGGILGGLVMFVWGNVSWLLLPWHMATMSSLENEGEFMQQLRPMVEEREVYYFPAMPLKWEDEEYDNFARTHRDGPVGMLIVAPGGDPMPNSMFAVGFLTNLACATMLSVLLAFAAPNLPLYQSRVAFCAVAGVLAGSIAYIPLWNWMHHAGAYCLVNGADIALACAFSGLVVAAIVKPAAQHEPPLASTPG